ncbi:hypothetical protein KDV96_14180 [Streptomyces sp. MW-W600-10]|nr:hypothetical protein [Streptomyces sp. MW-W600-10]
MKPSTTTPARATTSRERSTTPAITSNAATRNGSRIETSTPDSVAVIPSNRSRTRYSCPARPAYQSRNGLSTAEAAPASATTEPRMLRIIVRPPGAYTHGPRHRRYAGTITPATQTMTGP